MEQYHDGFQVVWKGKDEAPEEIRALEKKSFFCLKSAFEVLY
jgi:hypothetical protein